MQVVIIELNPYSPQPRSLEQIADGLRKGGLYILPTDTVYAFACLLDQKKAIEKIYSLKSLPNNKPLSLYCRDFTQTAEYARMDNNKLFRWMKINLPGPFTLVFEAAKKMPQYTLSKQKKIGIRIIDHPVIASLLKIINLPIIGSSVTVEDEYLTYPRELNERYGKQVNAIIDAGPLEAEVSTVLDAIDYPPSVIRQGKGMIN